jgi:hypothetical protein
MRFISPIQWIHWKTTGTLQEMTDFRALEVEILDEVHQSNPMDPLEDYWNPARNDRF